MQSAEHRARPARGFGSLKEEGKGNNKVVRNVGDASSRPSQLSVCVFVVAAAAVVLGEEEEDGGKEDFQGWLMEMQA